ncbi:unnamed protein product [Orchesella dallaii]|uniref:C2H2-type domain-containing protein n=1 Tax=Orchesella dallaii TaxID=48710 RepID=A0ABP1QXA8_9HEXA
MAEANGVSVGEVAHKFWKTLSSADRDKLFSGWPKVEEVSEQGDNVSRKRKRSGFRACKSASATPMSSPDVQAAEEVIAISSCDDSEDGREEHDLSGSVSSQNESQKECFKGQASDFEQSVDGNNSDTDDDSIVALPQESEYEEESDDEWDWDDVITIDDDDDDKGQNSKDVSGAMICYRCPNKRLGRFKDKEKFRIHCKRHVFGDHYVCATCGRPFTKISFCLSHEIRVHGAKIDYDKKDPVISFAKKYVEAKNAKRAQRAAASGNPNAAQKTDESDETDSEDAKFYSDLIVSSSTLLNYRGPAVNNMLEAYEIQVNHSGPKFQRATQTARMALEIHECNVERNQDDYKLGRFSKIKKKVVPGAAKRTGETTKKGKSVTPSKLKGIAKRVLSDGSDVERTENPKKKRKVRYQYITSSSSSSSEDDSDSDFQPSKKKRRVGGAENGTDEQLSKTPSPKHRKKVNGGKQVTEITRKLLKPTMIDRICQLCNYVWKTGEDLRLHRDAIHPNLPMTDLLPVVEVKEKLKSKPSCRKPKSAEPVFVGATAAPPTKKKQKIKSFKSARMSAKGGDYRIGNGKATKGKAKGKQTPLLGQPKRNIPIPNDTFSEKEKYLYALGLINVVRLDVFRNKGKGVKLPRCRVMLKKLNIESCTNL